MVAGERAIKAYLLTLKVRPRTDSQEVWSRRVLQARYNAEAFKIDAEGVALHVANALVQKLLLPPERCGGFVIDRGPIQHVLNGAEAGLKGALK
jgi:hypothetical protein